VSKHRGSIRRRRRWLGLVTVAALTAVAVMVGPSLAQRVGFDLSLPWGRLVADPCPTTQVRITVAPELADATYAIVEPLQGTKLVDGHCLRAEVSAEAAPATVLSARTLPVEQAPQLWIPESSLWERQVEAWTFQSEGPLATSPLVIATSESVVGRLGWAAHPPEWAEALSGVQPVAMPDLRNNASGLLAILGLWQSLNKTPAADQAVAAAVLASTRSTAPTPSFVIDKAVADDPATPLLVTSELNVFTTNRRNASSRLVAVYPRNGSPSLDYPILRVMPRTQGSAKSIATDAVVGALESASAHESVRRSGLRDVSGGAPVAAGVSADAVAALDIPGPAEITAFMQRLQSLTLPMQLTVVIDVSLSMRARIDGKLTRIQLAGQGTASTGDLLSDRSSAALWIFSRNLPGMPEGTDYQQLDKLLPLGSTEAGRTHREAVTAHLVSLSTRLGGDGTALYSAVVAATKSATRAYNPAARNGVVLLTDGVNEDPDGPSLTQTLSQLESLANPDKPVRLIAIGLGPEPDLSVLKQLAAPSLGEAYRATTAKELKTILFDALAHDPPDVPATAAASAS
jgi:Ca-activated chloride channel family protein